MHAQADPNGPWGQDHAFEALYESLPSHHQCQAVVDAILKDAHAGRAGEGHGGPTYGMIANSPETAPIAKARSMRITAKPRA